MQTDYVKYRGKCKEYVDKLCASNHDLKPVRGYYHCWSIGKQAHWWAVDSDGNIIDPTIKQFPAPRIGEYEPFDGTCICAECGKEVDESVAKFDGRYAFCSYKCNGKFVGVF